MHALGGLLFSLSGSGGGLQIYWRFVSASAANRSSTTREWAERERGRETTTKGGAARTTTTHTHDDDAGIYKETEA